MGSQLQRSQNKMLGGVCAGIAEWQNWDANLVRIIAVVATFLTSGIVPVAYVAAWLLLPERGTGKVIANELTHSVQDRNRPGSGAPYSGQPQYGQRLQHDERPQRNPDDLR